MHPKTRKFEMLPVRTGHHLWVSRNMIHLDIPSRSHLVLEQWLKQKWEVRIRRVVNNNNKLKFNNTAFKIKLILSNV